MSTKDLTIQFLESYRKTPKYIKQAEHIIFEIDRWDLFLQKRIKETHGHLSKEEIVFWCAFLTEEPRRIKTWLKFCRLHGFLEQSENAEDSLALLESTLNGTCHRGQPTDAQSLNPEPKQMELKDLLPEKLKADEAVKVFQKAIDAQLITYSPEGLKWNGTKQLLAYFATKVNEKFRLTTRLDKDGNETTAWKPFEALFKEQELKGAKQNWMRLNTKFEPTGFDKVDALL